MCRPTCESVCATAAQFIVMCLPYISLGRTACLPIHRFDSVSFCTLHLYKLISSSFSLGVYFTSSFFFRSSLPCVSPSPFLTISRYFSLLASSSVQRSLSDYFAYLFVCLSVCLDVCWSVSLFVHRTETSAMHFVRIFMKLT